MNHYQSRRGAIVAIIALTTSANAHLPRPTWEQACVEVRQTIQTERVRSIVSGHMLKVATLRPYCYRARPVCVVEDSNVSPALCPGERK